MSLGGKDTLRIEQYVYSHGGVGKMFGSLCERCLLPKEACGKECQYSELKCCQFKGNGALACSGGKCPTLRENTVHVE